MPRVYERGSMPYTEGRLVLHLTHYPTILAAGGRYDLVGEIRNVSDERLWLLCSGSGQMHVGLWDETGVSMLGGAWGWMGLATIPVTTELEPGGTLAVTGSVQVTELWAKLPGTALQPGRYLLRGSFALDVTDEPPGPYQGGLHDPTVWWRPGNLLSPFYPVTVE
jgi:hypothetical protein